MFTNTDIILYFKCLDQTEELSAMDINFIEMEQSLRKQLKEDQKQTMNTIQSLCKLHHWAYQSRPETQLVHFLVIFLGLTQIYIRVSNLIPPIFDLLKLTCLVTLFDHKLQVFKNSPNWTIFGIFDELLSTQNVNVARFARNVE